MDIIVLGIGPGSSIADNVMFGLAFGEGGEPEPEPSPIGPFFIHNESNLIRRWRELTDDLSDAITERYS